MEGRREVRENVVIRADLPSAEEITDAFIACLHDGRVTEREWATIMEGVLTTLEERKKGYDLSPLALQAHHFAAGVASHAAWVEKRGSGASKVLEQIRTILDLSAGQSTTDAIHRLKRHAEARNASGERKVEEVVEGMVLRHEL
jgi:hypothetical protein